MSAYRRLRLAARALLLIEGRLLVVNAYADPARTLLCAPGGGAEPGEALTATLAREVHEETGLAIRPGPLAGISEFHDPAGGFHQVDMFFHAEPDGPLPRDWTDPESIVHRVLLLDRAELTRQPHKPDHLAAMAFDRIAADYHGLELKV